MSFTTDLGLAVEGDEVVEFILQTPFENGFTNGSWRDSSSGCGPERIAAGWPPLRRKPSAIRPISRTRNGHENQHLSLFGWQGGDQALHRSVTEHMFRDHLHDPSS